MKTQRILTYHSISASANHELGAELYAAPVERFREQMEYVVNHQTGTVPFGDSPCLITFDDGLIDNYTTAYPILKEFGLSAYFFVIAPLVGTMGYMDWFKIRLLKEAGMKIGSHGMTHRILTGLSDKELDVEFKESKKMIEENLGAKIDYLSIPRGFSNQRIITKAKEAGYSAVFTSSLFSYNDFEFGRIAVKANWNLDKFISIVNNGYSLSDRTRILVKKTAKTILGPEGYDRFRTGLLKRNISY